MSEQPITQPLPANDFYGEYTWADVGRDMKTWHPDLQAHAIRHLESNDIQIPHTEEAIEHESAPVTTGQIKAAFEHAGATFMAMTQDPAFDRYFIDRGLDPYDIGSEAGSTALAGFVHERMQKHREKGVSTLQTEVIDLLAATPQFLHAQSKLVDRNALSYTDKRACLEAVSSYNGYLRSFAIDHPEANVADTSRALASTAIDFGVEGPAGDNAAHIVDIAVKGARHELLFGAVLASSSHMVRAANIEEDLRGIDFVIDEDTGDPLYLDAKASLYKVRSSGENRTTFIVKNDEKVITWSLYDESQLGATFKIDRLASEQRVPILEQHLARIRTEIQSRRVSSNTA